MHIFIIPYFNLKYVCYEKKIKGKMLICVAVLVVLSVFIVSSVFSLWKGIVMKKDGKLIKNELAH